jgi:hypothetical protein
LAIAIFILLETAAARGQSTAELVGRLQQQVSAARTVQLNENSLQLLRELNAELINDRYPSAAALQGLAADLSQAGGRLAALAPDVQRLAQQFTVLSERSLAEANRSWLTVSRTTSLDDDRRPFQQAIERYRARFDRVVPEQRAAWDQYLYWSDVRELAEGKALDGATLDRLEARWTNVQLTWNDPEISRTAVALKRFIRSARRASVVPSADDQLANLAKVSELLQGAPPTSVESRRELSEVVARLEGQGIAPDLTTAIRLRISYPNAVVQIANRLLASHFAQPLEETFRINDVFAGTRAVGDGRLNGAVQCRPSSRAAAAGWTWLLEAKSTARTAGSSSGVVVASTGATSLSGSKQFSLNATGLSALPATADARTSIQFQGINAGGGGRRQGVAVSEVYATRPRAEADSEASARRSAMQRLDSQAAPLLAECQRHYDRAIKSPLGRSTQFVTTIRTAGGDSAQTWLCWLEELHGLAASDAAPPRPLDSDLMSSWQTSFLERHAATKLAGRKFTAAGFSRELSDWLGADASNVEEHPDDWRLQFTPDRPVVCRIASGQIHVHLRLAEFADAKSEYPAVSVHLVFAPESNQDGWVLRRTGTVEAYPLDYEPGTGGALSGRQLVLRRAVQRSLEGSLRREVAVKPLEYRRDGAVALRMLPHEVRAEAGWLSIDWRAPPTTSSGQP